MNSIDMDVDTRCTVMQYLRLISKRASGKLVNNSLVSVSSGHSGKEGQSRVSGM